MKSIVEQENELFSRWREKLEKIVPDGVFDEACYANSSPKILFILKEPHSQNPDDHFDLREVVRDGKIRPTWENISRWSKALRLSTEMGAQNLTYRDIETSNQTVRRDELKNICVMNLKKRVGKTSTNMPTLNTFIDAQENYKDFFIEQFNLYKPDIVICCGSGVAEKLRGMLGIPDLWTSTERGVWYFMSDGPRVLKKDTPIISWVHPQLRGSMRWPLAVFPLVDAWAELSKPMKA